MYVACWADKNVSTRRTFVGFGVGPHTINDLKRRSQTANTPSHNVWEREESWRRGIKVAASQRGSWKNNKMVRGFFVFLSNRHWGGLGRGELASSLSTDNSFCKIQMLFLKIDTPGPDGNCDLYPRYEHGTVSEGWFVRGNWQYLVEPCPHCFADRFDLGRVGLRGMLRGRDTCRQFLWLESVYKVFFLSWFTTRTTATTTAEIYFDGYVLEDSSVVLGSLVDHFDQHYGLLPLVRRKYEGEGTKNAKDEQSTERSNSSLKKTLGNNKTTSAPAIPIFNYYDPTMNCLWALQMILNVG